MPTSYLPTRRHVAAAFLGLCFCLVSARPGHGQPPADSALASPRLFILNPPGGQVGTTVECTFLGADLNDAEKLIFSNPNIKAEAVKPPDPPPADPKKPDQPQPAPQITKFKVTIGGDVPPGTYDARLITKGGISNPRAFTVGNLKEVMEVEPNNDLPQAQRVEINSTINGNLTGPTDVDYYVFAGKKGQRVVLSCLTSSIDSRMHPEFTVYDAKGKQLATGRPYQLHDALTDVTLPDDGDYYVRLYEFTHTQGTAEHFYRLSITTAPWIDAIHPAVIEPGKTVACTVYGRNLPGGQLDKSAVVDGRPLEKITVNITAPKDAATQQLAYSGLVTPPMTALGGCFEYRVKNDAGTSNPFMLSLATAPVIPASGDNPTMDKAQNIAMPCELDGCVMRKHQRDWYSFSAKKGEIYNIELISDRVGVSGHMYFVLRNLDTKADIVESQDNPDVMNVKFYGRTEDPLVYRFTVPADGKYGLMVSSRMAASVAGPRQQYRVRISADSPDFQLVAVAYTNEKPSATTVPQGGQAALTVFAWRRDGFNGEIALNVEGLPPGVTCPAQALAPGVRQTTLVLSGADNAEPWVGEIKVKGTATVKGQKVTKEARAGGIVWPVQPQQNIVTISRVERQTFLAVREKPPFTVAASIDKPAVTQGTNAVIKVNLNRIHPDFKTPLTVQATAGELPQGFNINNNQPITIAPDKTEGALNVVVPGNVPPGTYNIVLRAAAQIPMENPMKKGQKQPTNVVEPTTPVTLTVLPKSLATVAIANANAPAKVGADTEYVVKVTRMYDYEGEFKVKVTIPQDVKDVTIDEVTIPPGKDEAKLIVKVAASAAPGNRQNLVVVATGTFGDTPVSQEVKFNVNVVK
jgi:hypothetical protein